MSSLGTVGTLSLILLFYILAKLSERFGAVVKMSPLYRYYYLSLLLALISSATHLISARADLVPVKGWFTNPLFLLLAYHLPLAIGVTIGLYITWCYWSWLVTELNE
jgi:hypothetical protein